MLYDQFGKKIDIEKITAPLQGRNTFPETSDRLESDVSRSLTPAKIDQILTLANSGETSDQCRLSVELEEKNWDIAHALLTRKNAILGIKWDIEPGDESAAAQKAADDFSAVLEGTGMRIPGTPEPLDTFEDLLDDMMSALLPGFTVSEIVWLPGGKGMAGFSFVDQRHFTFRDGFFPRLVTRDNSQGMDLPPNKFILHKYRRRGGDPARGGLIRPLAWLHCFASIDFKDLLRFMERYGMPFVVAKVDQQAWDNERSALKSLIRNFGPDGGGVFTKSVEFELLQAVDTKGEIYFKLSEYLGAAITKVILGQTATSSDGGGFSKDNAQAEVRQDILEADCKLLAKTVKHFLIDPWSSWNISEGIARPKMKFHCEPPEDKEAAATTVKTLFEAGLEADPDEMSDKFGIKLTRTAQEKTPVPVKKDAAALSDDEEIIYTPEQEKLFAQFADYMSKYLDDPDGLDKLALALDNEPEELFASFGDDLENYLEKDLIATIKMAKKEIADARSV